MAMDKLPTYIRDDPNTRTRKPSRPLSVLLPVLLLVASLSSFTLLGNWKIQKTSYVPINAAEIAQTCRLLDVTPGPTKDFNRRTKSDRFVKGTPPTLLKNATIWTGRASGIDVVRGDLLLDGGIIKAIGHIKQETLSMYSNLVSFNLEGGWVTPGIVDLHSHLGVDSAPTLSGSSDTNSHQGLVLPWLRSLDGLNTHDDAYRLSISGGVTTANVLPGSANAIGGQAFTIKLRPTTERSSSAMLLEPPFTLNQSNAANPPRWRQMKHACGENPSRVYSGTRMDTIWAFRQGYNTARIIKDKQDAFCANALAGNWKDLGDFPEDLQWEALVDVLRGRVKVHTHCYEAVDLDGIVRLSNEFKFPIAAFHHAHETYLVPDLLKKTYGHPPAVALFATNARYKREAYRGSEFAPRILAENGLKVVMKSDHPVLDSRHLLYEAQQAHFYGLPENLALASVISTPATVLGMGHRIGFVKPGYDADIVVWDSHPLALGATPKQVYIDGISQIENPFVNEKSSTLQHAPKTPNFDKEAAAALKYDGLPPLMPHKSVSDVVIFSDVRSVHMKAGNEIREFFTTTAESGSGVVIVEKGQISCIGDALTCSTASFGSSVERIDLYGGSISPALVSFGSPLGLNHIQGEASTNDGRVLDPLRVVVPGLLGGDGSVIRAVDGLQFSSRDALLAYRSGVTTGITAPVGGFLSGLSTAFGSGLPHRLADGAVLQDVTAFHVSVGAASPSVSSQIAALRHLLSGGGQGDLASVCKQVVAGELPLVVTVHSADIMASLIRLKADIEAETGSEIRLTFAGANEAHILAKEIGEAHVGVIVYPRPFPHSWKSKRILPGPPLSRDNSIAILLAHNVTVGVGIEEQWSARNTRFDIAWASIETGGTLSQTQAISLASVNLETLLGVHAPNEDLVVVKHGSLLDFEGQVAGIISPSRETVDLF